METLDEIKGQYLALRKQYERLRKRQDLHSQLYWQEADLGLPPKKFGNPSWPDTAMRIVEAPADHSAMDKIIVKRQPLVGSHGQETIRTKKEADKVEAWLQGIVDYARMQEPYFLRELFHNDSWFGEKFLRVGVNPDLLKDKFEGVPFMFEVPTSYLMMGSLYMRNCVPNIVFEEKVISLGELREKAAEWNEDKEVRSGIEEAINGLNLQDTEYVTFVEWWTAAKWGYLIAHEPKNLWLQVPFNNQFSVPNEFGVVPYCRGFSGRGVTSHEGDPASLAVGILTGIERSLLQEARLNTIIDAIVSKYGMPNVIATLFPGYVGPQERDADFGDAGILVQEPNRVVKWEIVNPPPIPPTILEQFSLVRQRLESYLPPITRGVESPGEPAASAAGRYNWASLIWEPQRLSTMRVIGRALGLCLQIIEQVVKKPVTFQGITIGPGDIGGNYEVSVKIEPGNKQELRWDYVIGDNLEGKLTLRYRLENFYHIENATQMELDLEVERDFERLKATNPVFQARLMEDVFEQVGLEKELQEAAKVALPQKMAEGSMAGAGGSPQAGVPALAEARAPEPDAMRRQRLAEQGIARLG